MAVFYLTKDGHSIEEKKEEENKFIVKSHNISNRNLDNYEYIPERHNRHNYFCKNTNIQDTEVKILESEDFNTRVETIDKLKLSLKDDVDLSPKLNNLSKLDLNIKYKELELEKSYNPKEIQSSKGK